MSEVYKMDKSALFAGGFVPRDISHCVTQEQYVQIYKEVQTCLRSSNNTACIIEFGCCCIGLYLLWCIHEPIANAAFDRAMRGRLRGINQEVFGGRDVLGMEGGGRKLKFTFNTALLPPLPVYAMPIPDNDNTANPMGVAGLGGPIIGYGGGPVIGYGGGGVVGIGGGIAMF